MTIKEYEKAAKEITGLVGKYLGNSTLKLEDGSKLMIGNTVAVQVFDTPEQYGDITYVKGKDGWTSSSMGGVSKQDSNDTWGQLLDDIFTFSEAAHKWGLSDGSVLRNALKKGKFRKGEIKQSGGVWLVVKPAMVRLYGEKNKED